MFNRWQKWHYIYVVLIHHNDHSIQMNKKTPWSPVIARFKKMVVKNVKEIELSRNYPIRIYGWKSGCSGPGQLKEGCMKEPKARPWRCGSWWERGWALPNQRSAEPTNLGARETSCFQWHATWNQAKRCRLLTSRSGRLVAEPTHFLPVLVTSTRVGVERPWPSLQCLVCVYYRLGLHSPGTSLSSAVGRSQIWPKPLI